MNGKCLIVLLLLALLPAGCVATGKKAAELADQAVYKPVEYENASVPGPDIVVLPGGIKSSNAAFVQKVTGNNLRDFAEIELSKDGFTVLDRAETQPFFNEIAIAANLGDAEALKVFRKGRFKTTKWFLTFSILKAEPTVYVTKGFDGATAGAVVDLLFTVANKGQSSSAGKMLGNTIASAKSLDTSAIWLVGLQYKIVDGTTGQQVASGYVEDKMEATTSMNSFLGVTGQQGTSITLDTMAQRLMQKAVAEIDKKYKKADVAAADEEPAKGKQHKKAGGVGSKQERAIMANYKKLVADKQVEDDKEAALTAVRCNMDASVNLDEASVLATIAKDKHDEFRKKYEKSFVEAQKSPDWRNKMKCDVSQVTVAIADYKPDACKVKVGGTYTVTNGSKTKKFAKDEVLDMVKEDGQWKIASLNDSDNDKEVQ